MRTCRAEAGKGFGTVKHAKPPKKKEKVTVIDNNSDVGIFSAFSGVWPSFVDV
jgi:hypothetical protein